MAPYVIAHFKVSLKLVETGYTFENAPRARIYLTNALHPAQNTKQLSLDLKLTLKIIRFTGFNGIFLIFLP